MMGVRTFIYYFTAIIVVLTCLLVQYVFEYNHETILRLLYSFRERQSLSRQSIVSSIWCQPDTDGHKLCSFKNLCYAPQERQFVFILSHNSVLSGIETKNDLQTLELSSISNHNQFIMKLIMVSPGDKIFNRTIINERSAFIMWRFKQDNIMHVIHDDLLPLYVTYTNICVGDVNNCVSKYRLVFIDGGSNSGSLQEWYRIFSRSDPLLLNQVAKDSLICFDEARTGLFRTSLWFQYGFGKVQGPINNTKLNGRVTKQFSNFIIQKFKITQYEIEDNCTSAVLISRNITRKILNTDFVLKSLNDSFHSSFPSSPKLNTHVFDLSVNNTKTILLALLKSKILVGMHGAEMILSIFLPFGGVCMELFPFGIDPTNVSHLKALANINGTGIIYESWENMNETQTVSHPDAPPLLGGIRHLSKLEQVNAEGLVPVPAVECCHHPAYLYRMFQDTYVGKDFIPKLRHVLKSQDKLSQDLTESHKQYITSRWWFPSSVDNITCDYSSSILTLRWNPSVNLDGVFVIYEITVSVDNYHMEFVSEDAHITINRMPLIITEKKVINIWVKSVIPSPREESLDSYMECTYL